MLQRAASNAYSWWWASHIRTKQSKWLEQNLQDIEEKVQYVLKLLQEDGDSFAKRAEMYYKKRPELISFVEESYRAYRALAERYDHISTELQNANTTIASVFPDQVPNFAMDDDDDGGGGDSKFAKRQNLSGANNVPDVPKLPVKDLKSAVKVATKKLQPRKSMKYTGGSANLVVKSSGLSKSEAMGEIDKLQKEILSLQTEMEFVKSSYERGLSRYWEFEKSIKEKQERICGFQDEFGESVVIEDDEARRLMTETAIKSCQEKLVELQEQQEKSYEEAKEEHMKIIESKEKLRSMASRFLGEDSVFEEDNSDEVRRTEEMEHEMKEMSRKKQELESVKEKIREHFESGVNSSLNATEMAERVDELVNKVISLESAVSSQTALIQRLRNETNGLQTQIITLETDKATLADDKSDLRKKLKEMEEKLKALQDLDRNVMDKSSNLHTDFDDACNNLDDLSTGKLHEVKPESESDNLLEPKKNLESEKMNLHVSEESEEHRKKMAEEKSTHNVTTVAEDIITQSKSPEHVAESTEKVDSEKQSEKTESVLLDNVLEKESTSSKKTDSSIPDDVLEKQAASDKTESVSDNVLEKQMSSKESDNIFNSEHKEDQKEKENEPDWKEMFMKGMENREKHLLTEYTTILRNYKDMKKTLDETETKLKTENATKDDEIKLLREKMSLMQKGLADSIDLTDNHLTNDDYSIGIVAVENENMSLVEEQFRLNIDELLEENLDFWLRFSTAFGQIQSYDTSIEDLQGEISKLEQRKKQDGSSTAKHTVRSDVRPLYLHLREINTDLGLWLEKGAALKEELKSRFESLCNIQEEITKALKSSAEDDDFRFTSYQAAKFQGEVLNMKQENNKVADELQAGLDHITTLQLEVDKTLGKLNDEFSLSGSKNRSDTDLQHSDSRSRVPLRSFIFGSKQKRAKPSIFSCMHPSLYRKMKAST
ncbi:hypothetical protein Bca4012_009871 [Brassica carinata]|uniref:NAB domain-containing protein n=1 Tax=Brassica carinata TaxID=52824 RepID=A0A8X7S243_BRACI|nr:hypothetical protein Bca52824_035097 [Brassica carinata]